MHTMFAREHNRSCGETPHEPSGLADNEAGIHPAEVDRFGVFCEKFGQRFIRLSGTPAFLATKGTDRVGFAPTGKRRP